MTEDNGEKPISTQGEQEVQIIRGLMSLYQEDQRTLALRSESLSGISSDIYQITHPLAASLRYSAAVARQLGLDQPDEIDGGEDRSNPTVETIGGVRYSREAAKQLGLDIDPFSWSTVFLPVVLKNQLARKKYRVVSFKDGNDALLRSNQLRFKLTKTGLEVTNFETEIRAHPGGPVEARYVIVVQHGMVDRVSIATFRESITSKTQAIPDAVLDLVSKHFPVDALVKTHITEITVDFALASVPSTQTPPPSITINTQGGYWHDSYDIAYCYQPEGGPFRRKWRGDDRHLQFVKEHSLKDQEKLATQTYLDALKAVRAMYPQAPIRLGTP